VHERRQAEPDHALPPAPAIPVAAPAPLEKPLAPLPERKEPVVFLTANLGETPMIRTWNEIAKASVMLTAFVAAPANNLLAGVPEQPVIDYSKRFEDINKQIEELAKAVKLQNDLISGLKLDERFKAVEAKVDEKISKIKIEAPEGESV